MKHVHKSLHDFRKSDTVPLVDDAGSYFFCVCGNCGLTGKQRDNSGFVEIEGSNRPCIMALPGKKVLATNSPGLQQFGFTPGQELETVPCPPEWDHKYKNAIWVFSPVRKEAVRLIHGEFQIV